MQLPTPFLEQMQDQLGPETADFLEALSLPAPTSIHINTLKNLIGEEIIDGVKWYENGVYIPERPLFTADPAFHAGAYYVQEASSMLVAEAVQQLLDLSQPVKVLDLCAAPGGKSTLLSAIISDDSLLVANEVIRSRFQVLDYNLVKWGASHKITCSQDVSQFKGLKDFFDLILVDAPCSGEGLFRKDPQAVTEWSPENVMHCSNRQQRILRDTVELLKPGGTLLYSTCTYNDRENSDNAAWLLTEFPLEISPLDFPDDWGISRRAVGFQCYPHRVRGEGFYLSAFRKTGASATGRKIRPAGKFKYFQPLPRAKREALQPYIAPGKALIFLENDKGQVIAIPESMHEAALRLSPHLRYFRMGTPVGNFKGRDLIPDPALALSQIVHPDFPSTELDRKNALLYLKKEAPRLSAPTGWHLVSFQNLNLGWIKVLKGRVNNYYPKEWRIRMAL